MGALAEKIDGINQWGLLGSQFQSRILCHRSPFGGRFATYAIFRSQSFQKHLLSLNNHTHEKHKCAGFWWKIWQKLMFSLTILRDYIQRHKCITFLAQGEWVIRLGRRPPTGQRRQRIINADCLGPPAFMACMPNTHQVPSAWKSRISSTGTYSLNPNCLGQHWGGLFISRHLATAGTTTLICYQGAWGLSINMVLAGMMISIIDYKNPLHLDVVDRYLRRMGDKTIPDEAPPSLESFYPPWVAGIDLPQSRCCGFFVSFTYKHK